MPVVHPGQVQVVSGQRLASKLPHVPAPKQKPVAGDAKGDGAHSGVEEELAKASHCGKAEIPSGYLYTGSKLELLSWGQDAQQVQLCWQSQGLH
jgi:hypothetical protein